MSGKLMGAKVHRVEDERFLRGRGLYVDDVALGSLHAAVLRSPHAHARIVDIDVSDVLDVEGVHAVWTYDDLTGPMAEPLPLLIPHPALTHGRTQYALARDEVNYMGEAIAFVVADDRLSPVQQAFADTHGLQCGFCTPGFLTTIAAGLEANPDPSEDEAREMVAGNLCRCTGYQNIVAAVLRAAEIERERT